MRNLIVLPTLDGSQEAAVERLGAWSTMTQRAALREDAGFGPEARHGLTRDLLDLLDVTQ